MISFGEPEKSKLFDLPISYEIGKLKERIDEGYDCPLEAVKNLRSLAEKIEIAINDIIPYAINDLERTDGKNEKDGYSYSVCQSGRYDYKDSDLWLQLEEEKKRIEKLMQSALKKGESFIDEITGSEIIPAIYCPSKKTVKISKIK